MFTMRNKIKILVDNNIPFLKGVLDNIVDIKYLSPNKITTQNVQDADALIIRTRTQCNESLLKTSKVKFIATATIGYDHIDTKYCDSKGINWINAPGCNSSSVMQYVASALFTLRASKNLDLSKLTIGIVGVGNVGSKVEKLAKLLGMNILLNDPPRKRKEGSSNFIDLQELTDASDIITFHVPLNLSGIDRTYHMADKEYFSLMQNKIIINTSRGEVIDSDAMIQAINRKNISSAVLDVWENEPDIDQELLNIIDIATPHIAGYSAEGKANGTAVCVNAVTEYFDLNFQKKWYPQEIPVPSNSSVIDIDCMDKTIQQILSEIILHTYSILNDDKKLRSSVETFEKQRNEYPIRREFPFYEIKLINGTEEIPELLIKLGFQIK